MNETILAAMTLASLVSLTPVRHHGRGETALAEVVPSKAAPQENGPQENGSYETALVPLLETAVAERAFPGAVIEVGSSQGVLYRRAVGRLRYAEDAPEMRVDTIFDLASLTKVIATTNLCMRLFDSGKISLEDPVSKHVPEFTGGLRDQVTVRHLLTHSSGLPAWRALFRSELEPAEFPSLVFTAELTQSPGVKYVYSDLGMILLGITLERAGKRPLAELFLEEVAKPLELRHSGYLPGKDLWSRCAPTEDCRWRGRLMQGEVHDENAYALGGVAGHAGLFSTAEDLGVICTMLLADGKHEKQRFLKEETVALFTRGQDDPRGSTRALGWGTNGGEGSSCGPEFSQRAFGHTGFTGTSIWCDPERDLYVVLLTNRVYPSRENSGLTALRPRLHTAVVVAHEAVKRD